MHQIQHDGRVEADDEKRQGETESRTRSRGDSNHVQGGALSEDGDQHQPSKHLERVGGPQHNPRQDNHEVTEA